MTHRIYHHIDDETGELYVTSFAIGPDGPELEFLTTGKCCHLNQTTVAALIRALDEWLKDEQAIANLYRQYRQTPADDSPNPLRVADPDPWVLDERGANDHS